MFCLRSDDPNLSALIYLIKIAITITKAHGYNYHGYKCKIA